MRTMNHLALDSQKFDGGCHAGKQTHKEMRMKSLDEADSAVPAFHLKIQKLSLLVSA